MSLSRNPDLPSSSRLGLDDCIDIACDAFEKSYKSGGHPELGDFLDVDDIQTKGLLFTELLLLDIDYRIRLKEPPTRAEYLSRYPEFAVQIEAVALERSVLDTRPASSEKTLAGSLAPQTRIGHFELAERLGVGAVGEVWRARDTRLQRQVAIKIPHDRNLSDDDLHRFLREGRASAQLQHPGIVRVFEVGRDGEIPFIVSELFTGHDLRRHLQQHQLNHKAAAALCADLADALHHAHEQGVIHRDLKPANILLDKEGRAHIADFGLAKWNDDPRELTLHGQLLGTPAYMSPEQATGDSTDVDCRTDIYSLGALLYQTLTGRCLFEGDHTLVIHAVINKEPTPPRRINRTIPRDLETICLKALHKVPGNRYPSAQELAVDLRRFLRGDAILARRTSALEKGWVWLRRRPAVGVSVFLTLAVIGLVSANSMLAQKNREILGLHPVTLTTEPAGAKIAFVPLDDLTGEELGEEIIRVGKRTPFTGDLRSGEYLVVVVLDDGRFHEVIRRVPSKELAIPGVHRQNRWRMRENGTLELRPIKIPDHSVIKDMAFIEGDGNSQPSFYIDYTEATVGQFRELYPEDTRDLRWQELPKSHAVTLTYARATSMAELLGKRLPTESEFRFAATTRGKYRWPWGNHDPPLEGPSDFGPVGSPKFDRLLGNPKVAGLMSNVAEWTSTRASSAGSEELELDLENQELTNAIFVGGDQEVINGDCEVSARLRHFDRRSAISRTALKPGLGFRCVRSKKPRYKP